MLWNRKNSSEQQEGNDEFQFKEEKFHAELERKNQLILQLKEKEFNLREENEELFRKIGKYEQLEENIMKKLEEREQQIEELKFQTEAYQQKELEINRQLKTEKQKIQELEKKIALLEEKEKQYQQNISSMTQNLSRQMRNLTAAQQSSNQTIQGQYSQLPTHCSRSEGKPNYPNYQTMGKIANAISSQGSTSSSGRRSSLPNMKGVIPTPSSSHTVQFNPFRYTQGR